MDLRLAYRIATMPLAFLQHSQDMDVNDPSRIARAKAEAKRIRDLPKIDLNNVARFFVEHPQQFWSCALDVPNWAPPFGAFFVEWSTPTRRWNDAEKRVMDHPVGTTAQSGLTVTATELVDADRTIMADLLKRIKVPDELTDERIQQTRWILEVQPWLVSTEKPVAGKPVWVDMTSLLLISAEGKCIGHAPSGEGAQYVSNLADGSVLLELLMILGLGISFMHCKNVIQKDTVDVRSFKFHRNYKCPKFTFKTLEIEPMKRVLRTEGRSDETGLKKALHICRGHFVTYTEERPLFGRSVGTFWKPDHVRGSADRGIVVKDYDVKTPLPNPPDSGELK